MRIGIYSVVAIGCLSACTPSANEMQARIDRQIFVGMAKVDAVHKMADLNFTCFDDSQSLHCGRVSTGFAHEDHYSIDLDLSKDKTTIVAISDMKFTGMGL